MSEEPAALLHKRDTNLHLSGPVKLAVEQAGRHGERVPNEPSAKIETYLGSLGSHSLISPIPQNDPARAESIVQRRKKQIEARVMKPEDIPESFWATQQQAAMELGHGEVEITDELREEAINVIQKDQRDSLKEWVEYLSDEESEYPTWFKFYALNAVTKLGDYDKQKHEFPRRSKSTTSPYPGLHREALSNVYDALLKRLEGEKIDDEELKKLLESANFAKLYTKSLSEVGHTDPELLKETEGKWVKYMRSENPQDAHRLADSLKAYGTGWCTSGYGYAGAQLKAGDFYVYYSYDKDGTARVPRIAIRMEDDRVVEVRGIIGGQADMGPAENTDQALEDKMVDTALEQLKELPGGDSYFKTAEDMKRLTAIQQKLKDDPKTELTVSDLRFLYELDHVIVGFGYGEDPRVETLLDERDFIKDVEAVFQTKDHQQIANQLIEAGKVWMVGEHLDKFTGLNSMTAHTLIVSEEGAAVAKNLASFTGLDHQQIANELIANDQGWAVAGYLRNFIGLDHQQIANELIANDQGREVAENLENFTGLDHQQIANELIANDQGWAVALYLRNFTGLDHQQIAKQLIEGEKASVVAENLENFTGLDHQQIARQLIDRDKGWCVADNLYQFTGLSDEYKRYIRTKFGN